MNRAFLAIAALLAACGPEPTGVDGSLTEICDLSHDRVQLELAADSFTLRFLKLRGVNEDTALKIGVILAGTKLIPLVGVNLAEAMRPAGQRAKLGRNVLSDPNQELPALDRGRLVLEQDPAVESKVRGEFSVKFAQGYQFGAGRTVHGTFEAEVKR